MLVTMMVMAVTAETVKVTRIADPSYRNPDLD